MKLVEHVLHVLMMFITHIINLQVSKALHAKGYILIVFGGGITGDLHINDMHIHKPLKKKCTI